MPAEVLTAFERRFGVRLLDTYGMTECEPLTLPVPGTPPGSCGWPSPDFKVAVLDEEDRPLPAGTAGRICVRPRTPYVMMLGYEADPEATVEAWRNLWFHTADRGRFDAEGFLHFLDRIKYAIRRGGENISLHGDLARILQLCEAADEKSGSRKRKLPGQGGPGSQVSVVAGAGFTAFAGARR
jgi:crotonobetaine/carnitine-CoA ligase